MAASFCKGILVEVFGGGGVRIEVVICYRAGKFDCTARLPTSTTPQSTTVHGGGGWNGRAMAWGLLSIKGMLVVFCCWGGGVDKYCILGWGGRIRPHRPIADVDNTTINERMQGRGLERPGYGVAALVL